MKSLNQRKLLTLLLFLMSLIFLIIISPFFKRENRSKTYKVNNKNCRKHFPIQVISLHQIPNPQVRKESNKQNTNSSKPNRTI